MPPNEVPRANLPERCPYLQHVVICGTVSKMPSETSLNTYFTNDILDPTQANLIVIST